MYCIDGRDVHRKHALVVIREVCGKQNMEQTKKESMWGRVSKPLFCVRYQTVCYRGYKVEWKWNICVLLTKQNEQNISYIYYTVSLQKYLEFIRIMYSAFRRHKLYQFSAKVSLKGKVTQGMNTDYVIIKLPWDLLYD